MENETHNDTAFPWVFGKRENVRVLSPELEILHTLNDTSAPSWTSAQVALLVLASWICLSHVTLAVIIVASRSLRRQPRYATILNLCVCNLIPSGQVYLALYAAVSSDFRCAIVASLATLSDFLWTACALYSVLAFLLEELLCLVLQPPALTSTASKKLRRSILALIVLAPWLLAAVLAPLALPVSLGLGPCQVDYRVAHLDRAITVASAAMAFFLPAFMILVFSATLAILVKNKWVALPEAQTRRSCMSAVKEAQTVIMFVGLLTVIPEAPYFFARLKDVGVVEVAGSQTTAMWLRLLKTSLLPFAWLFYHDFRRALRCRKVNANMSFADDRTATCTGTFRYTAAPTVLPLSPHTSRARQSTQLASDSVRSVISGSLSSVSTDSGGLSSWSHGESSPGRTLASLRQARRSIEARPRGQTSFLPAASPQLSPPRPRSHTSSAADYARPQGLARANREARSPSDPSLPCSTGLWAGSQTKSVSGLHSRPGSALEEARAFTACPQSGASRSSSAPRASREACPGRRSAGSAPLHPHRGPDCALDPAQPVSAPRQPSDSSPAWEERVAGARPASHLVPGLSVSHARNLSAPHLASHPSFSPHKSVPNLSSEEAACLPYYSRPRSALECAKPVTADRPLCQAISPSPSNRGEAASGRVYCRLNSSSLPDVRDAQSLQTLGTSDSETRREQLSRQSRSQFYEMYIIAK